MLSVTCFVLVMYYCVFVLQAELEEYLDPQNMQVCITIRNINTMVDYNGTCPVDKHKYGCSSETIVKVRHLLNLTSPE